jgi:DNA-binding CsgD family transcriptional regulator
MKDTVLGYFVQAVLYYWREIVSFCPVLVLVYFGYTNAPISAFFDTLAVFAVIVLVLNPFYLLSQVLAPVTRAFVVATIVLIFTALRLPAMSLYFRICFLLIACLLGFITFKKAGSWFNAYRIRQSPQVDKVLSHMANKGADMDAQVAWERQGAREARAVIHQSLNIELTESHLEGSHRAVYLLGYLHGNKEYSAKVRTLTKKLDSQKQIGENMKTQLLKVEDKSKEYNELSNEVYQLRQQVSNLESRNTRLHNNLREARMEVERLQPPPPEQSRNDKILEFISQGHSQSETAKHFEISPATVSRIVKTSKDSVPEGEKAVS